MAAFSSGAKADINSPLSCPRVWSTLSASEERYMDMVAATKLPLALASPLRMLSRMVTSMPVRFA